MLISTPFAGFRDFILRGNVVDLAVAVVIGSAFTQLVNAFVAAFITPLIGMIGSQDATNALTFTVLGSVFPYGLFITALITFIIVCTIIYFAIVLPLMGWMSRLFPKRECPECLSDDLDAKATRCKYCCSVLPPLPKDRKVVAEDVDEVITNPNGNA